MAAGCSPAELSWEALHPRRRGRRRRQHHAQQQRPTLLKTKVRGARSPTAPTSMRMRSPSTPSSTCQADRRRGHAQAKVRLGTCTRARLVHNPCSVCPGDNGGAAAAHSLTLPTTAQLRLQPKYAPRPHPPTGQGV